MGTLGTLDANGNLWLVLPDGDLDVTPKVLVTGPDFYIYGVGADKYKLVHHTKNQALTDKNRGRLKIGVGEELEFYFADTSEDGPPNDTLTQLADWQTTVGHFYTQLSTPIVALMSAPDTKQRFEVWAHVHGVDLPHITYDVKEPAGFDTNHTHIVSTFTNRFPKGVSEARMQIYVYMQPTDVSFYKVWMEEVGEDATNIWGYFTDTNLWTTNPAVALTHKGDRPHSGKADDPFQLDSNNLWDTHFDVCDSDSLPANSSGNWSPGGGFTWNIPWKWGVGFGNITHLMTNGWQQVFMVDADGKVTITKFNNLSVTRDTNNVVVPSL